MIVSLFFDFTSYSLPAPNPSLTKPHRGDIGLLNRRSRIFAKLDVLQPSGSFKSRGIGYYCMARLAEAGNPADVVFYSASGGNAGLACVHAATFLGRPATVVVPLSTSRMMMDKLLAAGAREVIQFGASLQEAGAYLRDVVLVHARERGEESVYVPPYDHPDIWAGHATVIDEVREQMREMGEGVPDVVVCSVGGGGLLNGIMLGMAQYGEEFDRTQILAVETMGADSLFQSLRKSEMVTLPAITSMATSLGAVRVSERTFELASRGLVDGKVVSAVLTDAEAAMGCWRFGESTYRFIFWFISES